MFAEKDGRKKQGRKEAEEEFSVIFISSPLLDTIRIKICHLFVLGIF